ncbi:MAG: hypothetical protein ACOCWH_05740, partial [Spirochaetota bacterium]
MKPAAVGMRERYSTGHFIPRSLPEIPWTAALPFQQTSGGATVACAAAAIANDETEEVYLPFIMISQMR